MRIKIDELRVKQFMLMVGIETQLELARRSGLDKQTVSRALNGDTFRSDTLSKLAEALNVNPMDLVSAEGFPAPHMGAPALVAI